MKMWFLLSCLVLLPACSSQRPPPDDPEPVVVPAAGRELCSQACDAMNSKLKNDDGGVGCEEGLPVPAPPDILSCEGGTGCPELVTCSEEFKEYECVSCVWFCEYAHDQASFWNTSCIANDIDTCAQIESICNIQ